MKCYNCGCDLSEHDFCTACGADVRIYKKILALSNRYYNEGLRKAQVRDLSGAVSSLRQSLKCNKYNTDARNLLGLVYFEMGEAVDAISEWVISKNFQSQKNIADDFLDEVQNNPTKWDTIRSTIKKYNQALEYCNQTRAGEREGLDLAVIQLKSLLKTNPNLVRGHQLLALLYMNEEKWDKALRCVLRALKIDANNTTSLYYQKLIEEALLDPTGEAGDKASKRKKKKEDIITYQSGNDVIIQPLNHPEHAGGATIINILIGLLIGCAIMWFLVLPSRMRANKSDMNKDFVEVSNQLTEKSASMDELQKRTDALEAENAELLTKMDSLTGGDGLATAYDILMTASREYIENPDNVKDIAQSLTEIDEEYLEEGASSDAFISLYQYLCKEVGVKASASYLEDGLKSLKDEKFQDAIDQLTKAYELDSDNVEALFNLAHAYRRNDQISKGKELYKQVISQFPDSEYASNAKEYVDEETSTDNNEAAEVNDTTETTTTEVIVPEVTTENPTETAQ